MDPLLILLLFLAALGLVVLGERFRGRRYGKIRPSEAAGAAYRALQADPSLAYHFSGPAHRPYALLGLDRGWTLVESLWQPLALSPEALRELLAGMEARASEILTTLQGYKLLDDRGRVIGNGYAPPGLSLSLWIAGENRVAISTPSGEEDQRS